MRLQDLRWFNGIDGSTPANEVGWIWVLLVLLFILIGFVIGVHVGSKS